MNGLGKGAQFKTVINGEAPFVDHFPGPWTHHRSAQDGSVRVMRYLDESRCAA